MTSNSSSGMSTLLSLRFFGRCLAPTAMCKCVHTQHTHTHHTHTHTHTHTHGLTGSSGGTKGGGPSSQSRRGPAGDRLHRQEHQDLYAAVDAAGIGTLIRTLDGHSATINARLERDVYCMYMYRDADPNVRWALGDHQRRLLESPRPRCLCKRVGRCDDSSVGAVRTRLGRAVERKCA